MRKHINFLTLTNHYFFAAAFLMVAVLAVAFLGIVVFFVAAVVLVAVLGISGVLLFGFSEKVRAEVIRWLTERFVDILVDEHIQP